MIIYENCQGSTSHRLARRKSRPHVVAPLQAGSVIGKTPKRVCVRSTVQSFRPLGKLDTAWRLDIGILRYRIRVFNALAI